MTIRLSVCVHKAISELNKHGFNGYLVGGAVRDYLMGKTAKDLDLTTDANKEEILEVFKNYRTIDVGTKYGTILVNFLDLDLEITPHRYETAYVDHRHPSEVIFIKDLKEDLARRDFTMNAIAFSNDDGYIDYFGGIDDIQNKTIRTVGNPYDRFNEDALRILRAVRFSFTLGFKIEENTKKAIFENIGLLKYISMERKISELKKILACDIYPNINEFKPVLNEFLSITDVDKKVDSFDDWRLKLAYILDYSFINNLYTLKLSNDDTKLIKTLLKAKKQNFDNDYVFCKTVSETAYRKELITFKSVLDGIDYFEKEKSLSTRIVDQLLVEGKHLVKLGYKGKIIKSIQNVLKDQIYRGHLLNSRAVLLEYVTKNYNDVMELKILTNEEYLNYYTDFKYSHFMQSPGFGEVYNTRGYETYYLGFIKNNEVVALCMAGKKNILNYSSFYAPRGILMDYNDKDLLKEVILELKKFLKKEKALYFKMDPGIIIRRRDLNSEIVEEYETFKFVEELKDLGFKHRGFSFDLLDSSEPRFTFRLNIEKELDEILKGMNSTNRNLLKRDFEELEITKNEINDLPKFYKTMEDTAIRESLVLPDISFYENFYNLLGKYESSDLYVATVDINKIILKDQKRVEELEAKNKELSLKERVTTKDENVIKNNNDIITKLKKELKELDDFKDQKIALSAVMTAKDKDKVWIVFGGNRNILKNLNANYHLYWHVIKDAKENGFKIVDFFGTHGKPTTDNPEYGLFLYKSKFGGDFVEFIGEFDLIINPTMNAILMSMVKARRKIKQKI